MKQLQSVAAGYMSGLRNNTLRFRNAPTGFRQDLGDCDCPAFRSLDCLADRLIAFHFERDGVNSRGHFDSSWRALTGIRAVDPDLGAFGERGDLCPSHVAALLVQLRVDLGLPVRAHFDLAGISIVARETQHQVVSARSQWKRNRSLTGLLVTVHEDIGARGIGSDEKALSKWLK